VDNSAAEHAMKIAFISPPVPGHLNPMTTLARKLQSRNHDVVFISWPDGEPSIRAADLTFLSCAVKEIAAALLKERPRWLELEGEEALRAALQNTAARTEAMLNALPATLTAAGVDAVVLDTALVYAELAAMSLGMPYIHVSVALHRDYSGCTPPYFYDWPHETTPAALARNRKGVESFLEMLAPTITVARASAKRASVCITHAGLNTVLESLAQGVPQVAIPVTVDQPGVAARIAQKKTGLFVPLKKLTVSHLSRLLDQVLNEPTYRDNARYFQKVIAETNGLSVAADLVEESLGVTRKASK
jgi:UDP:flavonoid glycosyltransferase YjiC (YdhE family)